VSARDVAVDDVTPVAHKHVRDAHCSNGALAELANGEVIAALTCEEMACSSHFTCAYDDGLVMTDARREGVPAKCCHGQSSARCAHARADDDSAVVDPLPDVHDDVVEGSGELLEESSGETPTSELDETLFRFLV